MPSSQASPALERACRAVATIGGLWFAFTAWWGIADVPSGGHLGNGAAGTAMLGETGWRWHSAYPLFDWFNLQNPYPAAASCHHPFGIFWLSGIAYGLFGHHDFVVNLPAAIMSTLMPVILWKLGKHCWGAVGGAAAVIGFVLLPLTVGYSIFHGLEVTTIFGATLFYMGSARWQTYGRTRDLVFAVLGTLVATSGDWAGYLALAPVLLFSFLRAFVLPAWMTPAFHRLRYQKWWALCIAAMVFTAMLWVWLFQRADKIGEWLQMAETRGGGKDIPLALVLESRKAWIEFSFTPYAIGLGKIAAVVALVRFIWKRTDFEAFSLSMLFGATVQYVVFKRGADVHIFWPHYFGAYFALGFAQLVRTIWDGTDRLLAMVAPLHTRLSGSIALGCVVVHGLVLTPDCVRSLKVWRETGGRYDDKGSLIRSHEDLLVVLKDLSRQLHVGEKVAENPGSNVGWEHSWSLRADLIESDGPSMSYPFWIARASALGGDRLKKIADAWPLSIYGDILVWKRGTAPAPVNAYSFNIHEPNALQWMFTNNVEPVRTLGATPDPFLTWEWRVHLDQHPQVEPTGPPQTLDELRIMHNVAVWKDDHVTAERLREQITQQLIREPEAHFEGGDELMGVRITKGVQPLLEVWFEAGGPTTGDTHFQVRSHIERPARLSLIPADPTDREMAWPPPLSTKLWKKGFIYKLDVVMNHRIGLERYTGYWAGGPARKGSRDPIVLAEVE